MSGRTLDGSRTAFYIADAARAGFSGAVLVLGGFELWEDGKIVPSGAAAISLLVLLLACVSSTVMAAVALAMKDMSSDAWETVECNQMYTSALALLSSAIYAGLYSKGDTMDFNVIPSIMLLLLGIMKFIEHGARIFEQFEYNDQSGGGLKSLRFNTKQGVLSLLISFAIVLGAALSVDKVADLEKLTNSSELTAGNFEDRQVDGILLGSIILLGTVAGLTIIIHQFTEYDWHRKINQIHSFLAYLGLVLLSVQIGVSISPDAYPVDTYLSANFWYLAAVLFGGMGALQLEGCSPATQTATSSKIVSHGMIAVFFIAAVLIGSLWSVDILHNKLEESQLVSDGGKLMTEGAQETKVALSLYAIMIILVVGSHLILTRLIDMIVLSGVLKDVTSCVGLFSEAKKNDQNGDMTPKRGEQNLVYALATAVFFATRPDDDWEVSVSIMFFLVLAARFMGFYSSCIADRDTGKGPCAGFMRWVWDEKKKQVLSYQEQGTLMGIVALVLSAVSASFFVFTNTLPWNETDLVTLAWFEFIALLLIYAHTVLTLLGCCAPFHAGAIPILRFGVSSVVLLTYAWSLGERALQGDTYMLVVPTLLLYLSYDANADEKF